MSLTMRSSTPIKFIYFDVGGVIFEWKHSLNALSKELGINLDSDSPVWQKYDNRVCRGENKPQQLWTNLTKHYKKQPKDIKFLEFWVNNFVAINEIHSLICKLSKKYPIGLLTNIFPGTLNLAIKKGYIPNIKYSALIESCEVGYVKPEKEIFEISEKEALVKPSEIFFIDDSKTNIKVAQKRGWQTHLFDPITSIPTVSDWAPLL